MTSKSDMQAFKGFKRSHREKWDAPLGKRKCQFKESDDCLGIAEEDQFVGHRCRACIRHMHRQLYIQRLKAVGKVLTGRTGRPVGSKDSKPRKKNTTKGLKG
jgi:hypothetical protein